ncbi:amino acid transporter, putative [Perkinsus marinus ATCC 50983]|uniref:Amino acid transporter, putative n=1 Tax=Perkinsus marinus (strain ATCC 50983 / TXsc) TaxID=423536 RepID=C5L2N4_PERM5|nr:amino acid transporter, putative [Perkinsus marinus ATCC 50983]EER08949.1 amino acid transporter, putative [Perkinsus marinus ATCC 50983]|eukprot:XP_002777133.1 amino acid transporter, putative [Perkinsus marinus ATCC 50983]
MLSTAVLALCKIPWSELDTDRPNNMTHVGFNWRQVMHALSMGTFAYMNQVNAVCITSELHKPTRQRLTAVCGWAALGLFLCYATLLSAVYLTFGQATTSNFLQSYPLDDAAVNACRVAVSLTLIFACPLNLFPITSSFFHAIDRRHLAKHAGVRILFNTIVLTICLITAIWVPDVGSFIGYVSAYMATPLMITIPAFVYIACCRAEDDMLARKGVVVERNLCRRSSRMVIPAIALSLTVLLWTAATVNIFASQKA